MIPLLCCVAAAPTENGKSTQDGSAMLVSEAGDWNGIAKWPWKV